MDDTFDTFYRTLNQNVFKYFIRNGSYYVYHNDMAHLPPELKQKNEKASFVKLQSIEQVVRDILTVKRIPVEEYNEYQLTKRGFPGNFGDFTDICIDDRITPTVFAVVFSVSSSKETSISCSFIKDGKIYTCNFYDDDLLSNLFSLCSLNNCIEILYNNSNYERIFNSWGIHCIKSKYDDSSDMIKKYMKVDLPVVSFKKEDCCLVNIADFDLVDFGLVTQQGKRLLNQWLRSPSIDQSEIEKRLDLTECFSLIRVTVDRFPDLKRIVNRIANGSILIQETIQLSRCIDQIDELVTSLSTGNNATLIQSHFLNPLCNLKKLLHPLSDEIKSTVDFNTSRVFIHLSDELKLLETKKFEILCDVEKEFLKVKNEYPKVSFSNKNFKISRLEYNQSQFDSNRYVVVSMLKTGVLFTTKSLSEINEKITAIDAEISKIETRIFSRLVNTLSTFINSLEALNYLVALIDIYKAFSLKVNNKMYSRPRFDPNRYEIKGMFHPELEYKDCILNDIVFDSNMCILTGPNMGGKSTFIKTLSMVSLYAQIGCYVPAKTAVLPIFDRIFLRIGARDCTSQKLSTFMVEMTELNKILRTATSQSLVLIDELGRGTSAVDGLSIAYAVKAYLMKFGVKAIMATHFSELGDEKTMNKKMSVSGNVLTYKIEDGVCDLSFGINVAEMARFPEEVISNAKAYLK